MDLYEAINYYTGDVFKPPVKSDKWHKLTQKIKDSEYTPAEFCYYCVHYLLGRMDPSTLMKVNLLLCDSTWEAFNDYKKDREKNIQRTVKSQREIYYKLRKHISAEIALMDPQIDLNALVRCDLALLELKRDPLQKVLNKYKEEAEYLWLGNPEYKNYVRLWNINNKESTI